MRSFKLLLLLSCLLACLAQSNHIHKRAIVPANSSTSCSGCPKAIGRRVHDSNISYEKRHATDHISLQSRSVAERQPSAAKGRLPGRGSMYGRRSRPARLPVRLREIEDDVHLGLVIAGEALVSRDVKGEEERPAPAGESWRWLDEE